MTAGWWVRIGNRLRGLAWQLRAALRREQVERELDEEHRFHIEMETERLVRQGLDPAEARRRALVAFGGVERWQQQVREARWTWGAEEVWRDARHALRELVRRPLFSVSAIGTMAVAIGAATTLFAGVEAVVLRPLPLADTDRVVDVELIGPAGSRGVVSLPDYLDYRREASGTVDLAAHHLSDVTLSTAEGGAVAGLGLDVSSSYFRVLGIRPALGRFFTDQGDRVGAAAEVVLSHDLWRSRFASDSSVVGRSLHVNGQPLVVVGVAPRGFHGTMLGARPAVLLPIGLYGQLQRRDIEDRMGIEWLRLFGRLAPDASPAQASAALEAEARRLAVAFDYEGLQAERVVVRPFSPLPPAAREGASRSVALLLAAAGVLVVIAAVNVAGMLLARASRRGREISLRLALGAGRSRVARQLLVEGLVLGLLSGAGGVGLSLLGNRLVEAVRPPGLPGFGLDLPHDRAVLAFALTAAIVASVVFGLVPAWHAGRAELGSAIRKGSGARSVARGRSVLVAAQVAMTLVLLVSTALLLRTLRNALDTDHGFDPEGVLMAEIDLRLNGYDGTRARAFYEALLEGLQASPEVASAALATGIPLGGGWDQTRARVPGVESPEPSGWPVGWTAISEGYFETLGFTFRSGGEPGPDPAPLRIVVNDALARLFWAGEDPVGRGLRFSGQDAEVAGVVPTGKYRRLSEEPTLFAWVPLAFEPSLALVALVRPRVEQAAAAAALHRTVASLDPHVPLIVVANLEAAMGQTLFLQRVGAAFVGAFALMALMLSATGIFGLLAYTVEQGRREIGLRMAVGADAAAVVRAIVARGARPVLIGIAIGGAGGLAAARLLRDFLYEVPPADPASFGSAALLLLSVGLVAAWVPASRATRIDPAATLSTD